MRVADFDFELPERLIAQHPPSQRGESRLLVLDRGSGAVTHTSFRSLPEFLRRGDRLVMNDTRVLPARLLGNRVPTGGAVECLLLQPLAHDDESAEWEALMHPGQKLPPGARVQFTRGGVSIDGEVLARHFHGRRTIRLSTSGNLLAAIEAIGHIPLPPYIRRSDTDEDRERYQTVYARQPGSIAAPTAGLHFTQPLLDALEARGVRLVRVTLRVGYGTFKPVRVEAVEEHQVDAEAFEVSAAAADELARARGEGQRIVAVGTTTTRVLETLSPERLRETSGQTDLFIRPGHRFRMVDALITNFHLPRSSLLMLVASFGGRDAVLSAYREAVAHGYRFYSYGDAMLIL
jgi:S-adenosylmethionine:tRNA ribosyltransferase-isomerase